VSAAPVSVIVPVYDAERFVVEALDSIWAQRYPALEVLAVDDGSTDGSAALVSARLARHPELRLLRLPANAGPGAARNVGLAMARGELLTFLDADDRMAPERLAFQAAYLGAHGDVDVVVGTEAIELAPGVRPPAWLGLRRGARPRYYQMSMMARRAAFAQVGAFDESFRMGSDHEWMCRAATAGVRTALVDRVLLVRRLHGGNLTYRIDEMRQAMERVLLKSARARIRGRAPA
jgi:glycosyltransferase involved in cell wall biosynthesis